MGAPKKPLLLILLIFSDFFICEILAEGVTKEEAKQLRDEVREMFYHAFDGYMVHAFPRDELKPLSCGGEDTLGGYALTLIDSLDTLAMLGDRERFATSVEWIGKNLRFDIVSTDFVFVLHDKYCYIAYSVLMPEIDTYPQSGFGSSRNKTVSVFETTIRILGGLLSAHLIASDYNTFSGFIGYLIDNGMRIPSYDDELLHLAEDLARRMLPAFDTPTGIPFGSVNLMHGITSTAGGGTLTLEFGVLSRLTNDPIFEQVTKNAVRGLWARRSRINLVGAHIDVFSGEWTQKDAGIGTSIDSFYEYLLKAYLLFGDEEYLFIFQEAYRAAMLYLYNDPWYVEVNMNSAALVWPLFNSLQAFWPGLQVLAGDIEPAVRTHAAFFSVWKRYGFTPEGFNLATFNVQACLWQGDLAIQMLIINGHAHHPVSPVLHSSYIRFVGLQNLVRLLESGNWKIRFLDAGRDMLASLQHANFPNRMIEFPVIQTFTSRKITWKASFFFIAETVKYLWLLFDLAAGPDNLVENGPYKSNNLRQETYSSDIINDYRDKNHSDSFSDTDANNLFSSSSFQKSPASGLIKGLCPGLTHGQRYGISYIASDDNIVDSASQVAVVQNSPDLMVSNHSTDSPPSDVNEDPDYPGEPEDDQRAPQLEIETPQIVNETDAKAGLVEG
ncbi:hypothetical protein DH2020_027364 [Rehmannia glutinosa]|uniref:alpha-1,2-Mannosidase n=1 Tax=Rehmannia glutinosa TaxID=99300 RepID=A0ABR0VW96_REHGL